jgi:hypothetical protein
MGAVLRDAKQAARLIATDVNKSFDRHLPVTSSLESGEDRSPPISDQPAHTNPQQ